MKDRQIGNELKRKRFMEKSSIEHCLHDYFSVIREGPTYVCTSCLRLEYKKQFALLKKTHLKNVNQTYFDYVYQHITSNGSV